MTRRLPCSRAVRTALVLVAVAAMAAPASNATPFGLGAFDTYGLLVNDGATGGDINTVPVNANIGIGAVTGPVNLHNEVVNGKVDCEGSCASAVSGGAITGTQPVSRGGTPPSGSPASVNSNVAAVETAITQAKNLSSSYGAEAASGAAVSITTGSRMINASSGFLDASGARLFTSTGFAIGNGNTLTINGTASDFVVIDITGTSNDKLDGALALTGGITSDQVLINFIGTGGNVQGAANGATLDGTFLIPNMGVQLNSLTIDGHLFGGAARDNFQFVSNVYRPAPSDATLYRPGARQPCTIGHRSGRLWADPSSPSWPLAAGVLCFCYCGKPADHLPRVLHSDIITPWRVICSARAQRRGTAPANFDDKPAAEKLLAELSKG